MICRKCTRQLLDDYLFCPWCGLRIVQEPRRRRTRGNGQGTVIKLPNGKYKAIVTLGYHREDGVLHHHRRTKTFAKKSDAIAALPGLKDLGEQRGSCTLAQLWETYSTSPAYSSLSASQQAKMGYAWSHLKDLAYRDIASLTVATIESWMDDEFTQYYPARDAKVLLSHLFDLAIRREAVTLNKAQQVRLPLPSPKAKRECWTDDEVRAFHHAWADGDTVAGYILIMCYTGMRFGELYNLTFEDIDLEAGYAIGGEKTEAGRNREIPLCPKVVRIIMDLAATRYHKLMDMGRDTFYLSYKETVARCGARPLPPQTCRHWFFTQLTTAGVQPGVIAETGGHASYQTTMDNYVRTPLTAKLAAVSALPTYDY